MIYRTIGWSFPARNSGVGRRLVMLLLQSRAGFRLIIPAVVSGQARFKHRDGALMIISLPTRRLILSIGMTLSLLTIGLLLGSEPASARGSFGPLMAGQAGLGDQIPLNPSHPDRYVVKRGDTLWDISAMFLRDPWYWPEIWYANPQIENPHLIYPGDVLTLVYVDGQPQLRLERGGTQAGSGAERLSPQVREESLESAIPTIPFNVISAFLSKGRVLEGNEIERLPYVVAIREGHMIGSAGNDVYVRGNVGDVDESYSVVHVGEPLIDPDSSEIVGYEGIFVGEGTIRRTGDPSTLFLNKTNRELLEGDRLITQSFDVPLQFAPRPPDATVEGQIIHVVDGVSQIGQYQIVVLNRGAQDGLEAGHVLTIWQLGQEVQDRYSSGKRSEKVRLPNERAGTLMVFKTYDRISYALIMQATSEIHILDKVQNPG
jgi:hypothetical protein